MVSLKRLVSVSAGLIFAISSSLASAENWSQFRGNRSDGLAQSEIPTTWDSTQNVRWKVNVAGEGWSGPVVWGDQVFLTVAVPAEQTSAEASKPEAYSGGGGRRRDDLTETVFRYDVVCLDAASGATRWRQTARSSRPPIRRHSSITDATETPLTDGERVYAYFGMTGVYCFDMNGKKLWEKDLGVYEMRAGWGTSSSPIVWQNSHRSELIAGGMFGSSAESVGRFILVFSSVSGLAQS